MRVFIKLAWRNLFRNKRRALIAGSAIAIGLSSLIFIDALIVGMEENMVRSATLSFLGEGQIHGEGFRETHDVEKTVSHLDEVVSSLESEEIVEHFSLRALSFGMIASPANVSSVTIVGVDPSRESQLTEVDDAIVKGAYLDEGAERAVVIGSKLAEILEVGIGDRVVVTVSQAGSGEMSQEMFRVSGIYRFGVREMDQGLSFVRLEKAQKMLGIGRGVHEIALKFTSTEFGRDRDLPFWSKYRRSGNEAVGWVEILPQLEAAFSLSQFSIYISGIILFGVVALGIVNTLFMSLHERMFEFGVLRALGTTPLGLAGLIIFEAAALALLSIGLGIILGWGVTYLTSKTGVDYRGVEMAGVTMRELLYPVIRTRQFIVYPLAVFFFTLAVSAYPACYAASFLPADAMRKSLK